MSLFSALLPRVVNIGPLRVPLLIVCLVHVSVVCPALLYATLSRLFGLPSPVLRPLTGIDYWFALNCSLLCHSVVLLFGSYPIRHYSFTNACFLLTAFVLLPPRSSSSPCLENSSGSACCSTFIALFLIRFRIVRFRARCSGCCSSPSYPMRSYPRFPFQCALKVLLLALMIITSTFVAFRLIICCRYCDLGHLCLPLKYSFLLRL